ncbi:hypothetical protein [Acidaminobacter sp.]|uniref:hypothetical protein n=1 Tax=Acidaminobacter sp. TaxID=1872102 RepID=UPI0013805C46|nr:hypothetical protein [Acidaminobacter sp.]MDK9712385.1 hypothetical protein [Acidaminobacter sp.]MZQ97557.1 hypothetical protein [Acidaminobacter sp.]
MRVLLIGQKIVTLEDLNSYFFEHHVHGYVSAGAPNLLSLDIVRQCGIHMIICQSSDYTMEHLLTFMNKVKEHDPKIVTLLITDLSELPKINESMLDLIDDFLVVPFTPSEFHTRIIKLISKSTSPHSKVSAEERLKSILALMSEHPELKNDKYTNREIDDYSDDEDIFIPDLDILKLKESFDRESITTGNDLSELIKSFDVESKATVDEKLKTVKNDSNHSNLETTSDFDFEGVDLSSLGFTGLTPPELLQKQNNISENIAEDKVHAKVVKSDFWTSLKFEELMEGIDFDQEPLLSEFRKQKYDDIPADKIETTKSDNSNNKKIENRSEDIKDVTEITNVEQDDEMTRESWFGKILEFLGRLIYFLLIIFLVILSAVVIKSYYDGGIASISDYGIYSNTGELQNSNPNLMKSSYPGALIVTGGVRPGTPFGDHILLILPWLGYIVDYAKTPIGFLIVIVAPFLLIFIIEIYYWNQRRKAKYY